MVKEEWGLPSAQPTTSPLKALPKNAPATASYGLHPEERPGKSKEGESYSLLSSANWLLFLMTTTFLYLDMSKRELIDLANLLEERLLCKQVESVCFRRCSLKISFPFEFIIFLFSFLLEIPRTWYHSWVSTQINSAHSPNHYILILVYRKNC